MLVFVKTAHVVGDWNRKGALCSLIANLIQFVMAYARGVIIHTAVQQVKKFADLIDMSSIKFNRTEFAKFVLTEN
jgi:hypothetical protein